jgi:hypothetical protein
MPARRLVRALYGVLIAGFLLQFALSWAYGEPYPALFAPGFIGRSYAKPGQVTHAATSLVAISASGKERRISFSEFVPDSARGAQAITARIFRLGRGGPSPEILGWLCERLSELGLSGVSALELRQVRLVREVPSGELIDAVPVRKTRLATPCS